MTSAPSEKLRIVLAMSHFGIFARHFAGLAESLAAGPLDLRGEAMLTLAIDRLCALESGHELCADSTVESEERGAGPLWVPQAENFGSGTMRLLRREESRGGL